MYTVFVNRQIYSYNHASVIGCWDTNKGSKEDQNQKTPTKIFKSMFYHIENRDEGGNYMFLVISSKFQIGEN